MRLKKSILFFLTLFTVSVHFAQNDTIIAQNNNKIVGEIKSMNKGVLKIKTSYSDSDFAIEWLKIKSLFSETTFLISTRNGKRYDGKLSVKNPKEAGIIVNNDTIATVKLIDIVYLRTIKTNFIDKIKASIALGYNFTKSNNFKQFSLRSKLGYEAKFWSVSTSFNSISSSRNEVENIDRTDAHLSYRYFLKNDWFPLAEINWLSNTEQNIELRTVSKLGIGKFIARTNSLYWGIQVGASYNNERFSNKNLSTQNSLEGFIGSELNLYDVKDFSLLTKIISYPGITESGRLRIDASIDLQYDLPLDFFIKTGITINYDNKSVVSSSKYDYIFQTSFGWEL